MSNVLMAVLAVAASGQAAPARQASTVTAQGGQVVRVGRTIVARPFGADLVDRLSVVGSYRLRGRPIHLVRGDAAGPCPSRFVFVTERSGGTPVVSSPFGACGGAARVQPSRDRLLVTIADPTRPDLIARFAYDGISVTSPAAGNETPGPICLAAARVDPAEQARTIAAFEQDYPLQFRRHVDQADIGEDDLRALVTQLACLAPWPAGADRVPTIATPLFASRHGTAAFAALATVAEDPASGPQLRAASRSFAAEMAYRVERREPL